MSPTDTSSSSNLTSAIDNTEINRSGTEGQRKFTAQDFLAHDENKEVIRTFLRFGIAIAFGPIAAFFGAQQLAVWLRIPGVTDGTIVGLVASIGLVLSLIAAYAYHAYQEEKRDYFAAHPEDTRPLWSDSEKKQK